MHANIYLNNSKNQTNHGFNEVALCYPVSLIQTKNLAKSAKAYSTERYFI